MACELDIWSLCDIVPLSSVPLKNYHKDDDENGIPRCPLGTSSSSPQCSGGVDKDFTIVPDANYYMISPLYRHRVSDVANKVLLAHLERYNMEDGLPVAPEARELDLSEFGNQVRSGERGPRSKVTSKVLGQSDETSSNSSLRSAR